MNHNIIFQKIEDTDLNDVLAIERQCYPNPWPMKTMQDCLDAGYQCLKGLNEQSPTILCYSFMMIGHEEAHLLKITVHPDHQKQGLAQAMLQRLILIARINHARKIWLEVRASHETAIHFYHRAGFQTMGTRRNYYRYRDKDGKKVKEDALIMCYHLV